MGTLLPLTTQTPGWGSQTASTYPTTHFRIIRGLVVFRIFCAYIISKCFYNFYFFFKTDIMYTVIYWLYFWEGGEICCFTYLCIHWFILVCDLSGDWTHNLGVSGQRSANWATQSGLKSFFLNKYQNHIIVLCPAENRHTKVDITGEDTPSSLPCLL